MCPATVSFCRRGVEIQADNDFGAACVYASLVVCGLIRMCIGAAAYAGWGLTSCVGIGFGVCFGVSVSHLGLISALGFALGARLFLVSMAGRNFRARLIFFFNFQEILAQELDQKLGPELVQNLGPEPGPKIWSKNCTKNLVHVDFV